MPEHFYSPAFHR